MTDNELPAEEPRLPMDAFIVTLAIEAANHLPAPNIHQTTTDLNMLSENGNKIFTLTRSTRPEDLDHTTWWIFQQHLVMRTPDRYIQIENAMRDNQVPYTDETDQERLLTTSEVIDAFDALTSQEKDAITRLSRVYDHDPDIYHQILQRDT